MNKEKLKEFIVFLKNKTPLKSEELLEKDFYISALLDKLASKDYAFKGGTCLSKIYLNYSRISEDIDFTFIDQKMFKGKSANQIKKLCSEKISEFSTLLGRIASSYNFDFKSQKNNKRYVELGGSSKLATFKIWYRSIFSDTESFIKIQINFLEEIQYPITEKTVLPILNADLLSETDRTYFSDYINLYMPFKCYAYDLREIVLEKVRALLTRKGFKARDAVDLYFIEKIHKLGFGKLKEGCIKKINFAIANYEKYKKNFFEKKEISEKSILENVEHLVLSKIDKNDFDMFTENLFAFLKEVKAEIRISC